MKYVLFNPYSSNGECKQKAEEYVSSIESCKLKDMTQISYVDFFSSLNEEDEIIICGGDGTLNRFINDTNGIEIKNNIYYYPMGTSNDFYADVKEGDEIAPVHLNEYIQNLPTVEVDGETYKFINGVGYGIDGYCCEVGDELHRQGKPANYTAIAIKGLLFHYKPTNATVIIDGVEHNYSKVWIAPTMFGRRYGGGMIPTPKQVRGGEELSIMIFHGSNKLQTLMIFPNIFKGEHVKSEKYVTVLSGKQITVKFNEPRALQIDGETHLGVNEYTAKIG